MIAGYQLKRCFGNVNEIGMPCPVLRLPMTSFENMIRVHLAGYWLFIFTWEYLSLFASAYMQVMVVLLRSCFVFVVICRLAERSRDGNQG